MKKYSATLLSILLLSSLLAACGRLSDNDKLASTDGPVNLSIGASLVGELPPKNNAVEQAIEAYTNTNLQIQWIPLSAYDEKLRLMIASGELPKLVKLGYSPSFISTLKAGQFWELGPLLKEYPHLAAINKRYYENISVNGKIYGIPIMRSLGRATIQYRKDWFQVLDLKMPVTLEDWYQVTRALTLEDPDGNGKDDTYGMVLEKRYNQDVSSLLTRISVSQGGPNKWQVENGQFTPEFMTEPFYETLKLFRRLYQENLINMDFPIIDTIETVKLYDSGRAGIQISGGNAQTWQDKLSKYDPDGVVDAAPLTGPGGFRVPEEPGNAGFLAISKDSVSTIEEVRKILDFLDKLLEPSMQTVISKGVENRHWAEKGEFTEVLDRTLDFKEVKPYRDMLPYLGEEEALLKPSLQPDLYRKNQQIVKSYNNYLISNPALTLDSVIYSDRGKELETIITDAETRFIMGQIDEAGWKAELQKWKQAGGEDMIREYEQSYSKLNK
ncbi:extracellular solute-binding protein [Paenibacillus prosopidis]|uniref:Carbohydrate ABC transporter substrate-binding protein (CUT1 family) n=1 Tax=Paenibacillus prosopidis TaxID=630520 RepID=A0A368W341_9BACL|nr:extracellular solute-binding protein [Paenibacillus prosopidis]RCW49570.1 carbohydrate ABC transporter substrate-binding protein (CUT1 family) [Paenibacillus prosopidis]